MCRAKHNLEKQLQLSSLLSLCTAALYSNAGNYCNFADVQAVCLSNACLLACPLKAHLDHGV